VLSPRYGGGLGITEVGMTTSGALAALVWESPETKKQHTVHFSHKKVSRFDSR